MAVPNFRRSPDVWQTLLVGFEAAAGAEESSPIGNNFAGLTTRMWAAVRYTVLGGIALGTALGACAFDVSRTSSFWVGISGGIVTVDRQAKAAKVEAESVRVFARWNAFERKAGVVEIPEGMRELVIAAPQFGVELLPVLAGANQNYQKKQYPVEPEALEAYSRFATSAAEYLVPTGGLLEIWNEWNRGQDMPLGTPRGEPEQYVALLEQVYPKVKEAYPKTTVLGGSMEGIGRFNDWTRKALDAGMLQYLDGLSFHPYVYWMSRANRVPERGMLGLIEELEQLLAQYPKGSEVPLYVTEIGWPTHDAREGVSLRQQADYISRALFLLRANPRVRGVWVHTLTDRPGEAEDMEAHFGLLFPDGSPKPAWFSFRDTARLLERIVECRRIDFGVDADEIAGVELVDAAGKHHLAIWTIDEDSPWIVELACRVTPVRKVLRRSVIGSGAGPPVALSREPDGESHGSITVGPTPTVIRDVGRHWRIVKAASRYDERESAQE